MPMDEWGKFWTEIKPGTMLLVNSNTLCVMKESNSHHTGNCLFNCNTGTIHHYSEYFLYENGIDAVKNCMVNRIRDFEPFRPVFEECVFNGFFISTIVKNPDKTPKISGATNFVSTCETTMDEFIKRSPDGSYVREELNAMWYAWCLAIKFQDRW